MTEQEIRILINPQIKDAGDIKNYVDQLRKLFSSIQVNPKLGQTFKDIFTSLSSNLDKVQKQLDSGIYDAKGLNNYKTAMKEVINLTNQLVSNSGKITQDQWNTAFTPDPNIIKPYEDALKKAEQAQKDFLKNGNEVKILLNTISTASKGRKGSFETFSNQISAGNFDHLKQFINYFKMAKVDGGTLNTITTQFNAAADAYQKLGENVQKAQGDLTAAQVPPQNLATLWEALLQTLHQVPDIERQITNSTTDMGEATIKASSDVQQLFNRLTYFFSIGNAIRLFTRTIRSALNTVKELDAAMTETATVTEYSVGQMWGKLDEYTEIANKLGATTLGTYKTITMFFQQGLNEQQALELATETMKMARVANIDYAEATQYMTAALRGFNLELNETQATRVNDVYSELAKITAADTQQIAIAMSKVASLANSANMELETTSAFLSQIIETTQEAPETAGTALKTIIARFSEVKKLFSEGELTGTDTEGEEVDVNKIGAALRTAGINLNEFILGNVGLDEIFMQLAEKWDSLTLVQQRYIATQAAGSRQQSRFIAMMQDYRRTVELVNAAYSSAGSGQEQFDKTLESIEAKLNRLKNSWNTFTMSIANSEGLKRGVDALNLLLTVINKVTDAFGSASGAMKIFLAGGIAKAVLAFAKPAKAAFDKALEQSGGRDVMGAFTAARGTLNSSAQGIGLWLRKIVQPGYKTDEEINQIQARQAEIKTEWKQAARGSDERKQLQQEYKNLQHQIDGTAYETEIFTRKMQAAGLVMAALGTGIKKIASTMKDGVWKDGLTTFGNIVSTLGTGLFLVTTLSKVLPGLATAIEAVRAALTPKTLLIIIAAVTALITIISAVTAKIKQQEKALEDWENAGSTIRNTIVEMAEDVNNLRDAVEELNNLDKGTLAWAVQLEKVKQQYEELIKLYPALEPYLKFNAETGTLDFDEEGYTEYVKQRSARADQADRVNRLGDVFTSKTVYDGAGVAHAEMEFISAEQLSQIYSNLLAEDYDKIEQQARNKRSESIGKSKEELISEMTSWFGEENEAWSGMTLLELLDEYIAMYVDNIATQMEEQNKREGKTPLTDKRGQNAYANYEAGTEELTNNLNTQIDKDMSAKALYGYFSSLEDLPEILQKSTDALKAFALETADALKKYEKLNKALSDNEDILTSGKKTTEAYGVAVGEVWAAAQEAMGKGISYDTVKANIDDFVKAFIDGSEEAYFRLQENLIKAVNFQDILDQSGFKDIKIDDATAENIKAQILEITQSEDFKLKGEADFTEIYNALAAIPGMTPEIAQALIQACTVEAQLVPTENGFAVVASSPGLQDVRNIKAGRSGKGGGSKKKNAWENPYDQLYNLTERNEEAIRRRNILEKEYNAILRDRLGSSTSLLKNSLQELANLQEQLAYQRRLQEGRIAQLNAVEGEMYTNSEGKRKSYADWGVTQYAHYNQQTNAIEIDWDAIDQVTDEEKGKAIEDYIKRLEELQKLYEQTQSDILDIEAAIDEINQRGKKDYLTFEQRIYDAIVKQYQDQIDAYASLSDQIDETNQEILDQLNEQIELERQIRDNTKKEEEIADKEARLAYLQRDTSGANQAEILALQKEIEEARQEYSDDLIDQQIEQIQKGNEAASEQRQKQIELMQEQLNYWSENGYFWKTVSDLIAKAINKDGTIDISSDLVDLLMTEENFGGLSEFGKMDWIDTLVKTFMQSMEGFGKFMMEQAENAGTITQNGLTYTYDKEKKAWMLGDEAYSAVYDPATGQYIFTRNPTNDVTTGTIGEPGSGSSGGGNGNGPGTTPKTAKYKIRFKDGTPDSSGFKTEADAKKAIDEQMASSKKMWEEYPKIKKSYEDQINQYIRVGAWDLVDKLQKELNIYKKQYDIYNRYANASVVKYYLHGGMADYTGPAWLDGTRTRPEAVLNADQTKLFISLRDILSSLKSRGGRLNELHGDTYVDLDVNANIGSDYDVDSLVTRLKRDILESSNYRNANVLSRGY